jgi:hypothetical protein
VTELKRDHFEDIEKGKDNIKINFRNYCGILLTGSICFRIASSGGAFGRQY